MFWNVSSDSGRRSSPHRTVMETPTLTRLCVAIQNFREALESNPALNDSERLSLENHLALLEITYIEWKRRNTEAL